MKYEHTFVYERDGEYQNAGLKNHDIAEARVAMEEFKAQNRGTGCVNFWIVPSHKAAK